MFLRMPLKLPSHFANVSVRAEATAVITSMLKIERRTEPEFGTVYLVHGFEWGSQKETAP